MSSSTKSTKKKSTKPAGETHQFQAETRRLLDLMIHSLYSNKEIFLREFISNASDALDRVRFESLREGGPELGDDPLEIRIEADPRARTLTVSDNGIGMTRQEVIDNLGTIARSGTQELLASLKKGEKDETVLQLIGQFGVGFYSSFMAAEEVEVVTRHAEEETATRWISAGGGEFTVADAEREGRGTTVTLRLKPEDKDNGIEDFTDEFVLKRVIKRYSDFVTYPIVLKTEHEEIERDENGVPKEPETKKRVVEEVTVNSQVPLWAKPESEVSEEEYAEFYRHISHDWNEPMAHIAQRAEGRFEYQALLFVPSQAPYDLHYVGYEPGLQLYVKRVLIMERCETLLPRYLRFLKGVVESPDLPLNVSREMLQNDRLIAAIRKGLVKKVLDTLAKWKDKDEEKYRKFWAEFGRAMKEGVTEDFDNKAKITELLLFDSSRSSSGEPEDFTDLAGYLSRMKEGREHIYYLTGESREQVAASPHLEGLLDRGYEVLYLTDPVDELLVQYLTEYEGKRLKSVGKGEIDLDDEKDEEGKDEELEAKEKTFEPLMERLQKELDEHVKHVRLSKRLTSSPACLVGADHDYSPQLEKLLQKGKGGGPKQRRILELNPEHPVIARMGEHFAAENGPEAAPAGTKEEGKGSESAGAKAGAGKQASASKGKGKGKAKASSKKKAAGEAFPVGDYAQLLFGYALLAEGSEVPEPGRFNRAVAALMEQTL
ncbi:MAG: molecular chaperone HtpG [Gemmatimonadota bacterium]